MLQFGMRLMDIPDALSAKARRLIVFSSKAMDLLLSKRCAGLSWKRARAEAKSGCVLQCMPANIKARHSGILQASNVVKLKEGCGQMLHELA